MFSNDFSLLTLSLICKRTHPFTDTLIRIFDRDAPHRKVAVLTVAGAKTILDVIPSLGTDRLLPALHRAVAIVWVHIINPPPRVRLIPGLPRQVSPGGRDASHIAHRIGCPYDLDGGID